MSIDTRANAKRRMSRPLRALTDKELDALVRVGTLVPIVNADLADSLAELSLLAGAELDERHLAAELAR